MKAKNTAIDDTCTLRNVPLRHVRHYLRNSQSIVSADTVGTFSQCIVMKILQSFSQISQKHYQYVFSTTVHVICHLNLFLSKKPRYHKSVVTIVFSTLLFLTTRNLLLY